MSEKEQMPLSGYNVQQISPGIKRELLLECAPYLFLDYRLDSSKLLQIHADVNQQQTTINPNILNSALTAAAGLTTAVFSSITSFQDVWSDLV
jgi:hypothetical protein